MKTKTGVELIAEERQRQISGEGWTDAHDDQHKQGELVAAAIGYATVACLQVKVPYKDIAPAMPVPDYFPWPEWWKPSDDPRRNLAKAGALIAAELARLDRLAATKEQS